MRSSLKQLVIILGDGNISESQSLPAQIRETTMKSGVLFVFIILDNPKMSLLDRQVSGRGSCRTACMQVLAQMCFAGLG